MLVGDFQLAVLVLDLVEEPHVLDRDYGLVGEGPQQRYLLVREGLARVAHADHPDDDGLP